MMLSRMASSVYPISSCSSLFLSSRLSCVDGIFSMAVLFISVLVEGNYIFEFTVLLVLKDSMVLRWIWSKLFLFILL